MEPNLRLLPKEDHTCRGDAGNQGNARCSCVDSNASAPAAVEPWGEHECEHEQQYQYQLE